MLNKKTEFLDLCEDSMRCYVPQSSKSTLHPYSQLYIVILHVRSMFRVCFFFTRVLCDGQVHFAFLGQPRAD